MDRAGYSGTPLVRKLGLKRGMRIRLIDPPADYWSLLGSDAASLGVDEIPETSDQKADFIHLFAADPEILRQAFASARASLHDDGMVWASWPKKSSGVPSEIGRDAVMEAGKKAGLVDIKVCAVNEVWSGLKFVIPTANRRSRVTE